MERTFGGLSVTDWLAIIGAFSWLPTILSWLREATTKPKITIVSGDQFSIGYTTFGPIINIHLGFFCENKKALIKQIEADLIHENNDTQKFSWVWFEEKLYAMDIPDSASPIDLKKNQNAIAIKLGTDDFAEKTVGFQQNSFKKEAERLSKELTEEINNLSQLQRDRSEIKITQAYRAMQDLFHNSFNWKVGRYTLRIRVILTEGDAIEPHIVNFSVSSLDVKLLKQNIEYGCLLTDNVLGANTTDLSGRQWQWVTSSKLSV